MLVIPPNNFFETPVQIFPTNTVAEGGFALRDAVVAKRLIHRFQRTSGTAGPGHCLIRKAFLPCARASVNEAPEIQRLGLPTLLCDDTSHRHSFKPKKETPFDFVRARHGCNFDLGVPSEPAVKANKCAQQRFEVVSSHQPAKSKCSGRWPRRKCPGAGGR